MNKTITFRSVRVGDYIYDPDYYAPNKWRKVTVVKQDKDTVSLGVGVTVHETIDTRIYFVGHSGQGIAIKRERKP